MEAWNQRPEIQQDRGASPRGLTAELEYALDELHRCSDELRGSYVVGLVLEAWESKPKPGVQGEQ